MRRCVFVIGSPAELHSIASLLTHSSDSRLRYSLWYTAPQDQEYVNLSGELGSSSRFAQPAVTSGKIAFGRSSLRQVVNYYHCFRYINGIKTWTNKSPLVIVQGYDVQTWLAVVACRWGGGQIVHLHSVADEKPARSLLRSVLKRRILRNARYVLCPDGEAAERGDRYPGCIVVKTGDAHREIPLAVEALLRWTGVETQA